MCLFCLPLTKPTLSQWLHRSALAKMSVPSLGPSSLCPCLECCSHMAGCVTTLAREEVCWLTTRDTAGQERFNSITSAYYRSAKGIVLVYDITKKETFEDLPKWMKMIDKYASEDAELLLVGNKLDCESNREITRQQGEKFAQQITGMRFCEASAKDNFNVDEIFLKLVDDILKKMPLDIMRNELSNSILSLQPEPEVPPELPPPRPPVRCC
ncbi:Ras-related protein Rab-12 [Aquarana catesbeiana]|uniref:small monomeric GTPase n=1 Tax=Aquarana catesbeiana TaxID=8400 RepID=A0A2G9SPI0_AQUCT|nr:Ras-related protein Rab-12 [Aquarana catesbeiana]